jgi:hypothetical protein
MHFVLVRQLLSLEDSSVHRQLLRMLQADGAGQHSEDAAQGVVLQQAGGVLPAIQGSPGPAGGAQYRQTVRQQLVLQEAEAHPQQCSSQCRCWPASRKALCHS